MIERIGNIRSEEPKKDIIDGLFKELAAAARNEGNVFEAVVARAKEERLADNPDLFHLLMASAVNKFGLRVVDIQKALPHKTSVTTVGRWVAGQNTPSPLAREPVIEIVANLVKERAEQNAQSLENRHHKL